MNRIELTGCTPEPLMSYLKALGVFRLVVEQRADPAATMSWDSGRCQLHTMLDPGELTEFFLKSYRPTPIIGPWGARSGFYPGSSESSARAALNRIVDAAESENRLAPFRDIIVTVRDFLQRHGFSEKVRDEDKLSLMRICRNELPDSMLSWLDTVFILTEDSRKFPPLLGTGGNEGSGSYVSTFAQIVVSLLIDHECDGGVANALFGTFTSSHGGLAVGHFNPGAIGGPNSSQGFDGGGGVNPWDYLLGVEGTLMLAGAAARRMGSDTVGKASFPFCVEAVAVGYASESDKEAGESTRAELWLPLWWKTPISLGELSQLFAEGRAQFGRRQAKNAVEFALALNLFGISRGIDAFVRYAFVMRNGLSYFAAPLGRIPVTPRPAGRLLEDQRLTQWLDRLRSACRDKEKTPARYRTTLHRIDRAMFDFANRSETGDNADRRALTDVLAAIGRAERTLADGLSFAEEKAVRPIQGFRPDWLQLAKSGANDGREFRLAASLASVLAEPTANLGPIRIHLEQVEAIGRSSSRVDWQPGSTSAVWTNRPLVDNLAALFLRRFMESERAGVSGISLRSRLFAPLADVLAFLTDPPGPERDGRDARLADLLWAMIGIQWHDRWFKRNRTEVREAFRVPLQAPILWEFGVLRLVAQQVGLVTDDRGLRVARLQEKPVLHTTPVSEPFHRLARNQNSPRALAEAIELAARRMWADQLPLAARLRNNSRPDNALDPHRLLAACVFPLSPSAKTRLLRGIVQEPMPVK